MQEELYCAVLVPKLGSPLKASSLLSHHGPGPKIKKSLTIYVYVSLQTLNCLWEPTENDFILLERGPFISKTNTKISLQFC